MTVIEFPGAVLERLLSAHEAEAGSKTAEFYNFGWVSGENAICSKTSKGILYSQIDPKTKQISHAWQTYEQVYGRARD